MHLDQDLYNQLSYYTLAHPDASFIHQHIVDAFTAQTADVHTKPIAITFALAGLYLNIERKFSGKQVQKMHMNMARRRKTWPIFQLPENRGSITVSDVLATLPGKERDNMIHQWCQSVWDSFKESRGEIKAFVGPYLA